MRDGAIAIATLQLRLSNPWICNTLSWGGVQTLVPGGCPDMRLRLDSNQKRPLDIARQLSHTRLEQMLDPATSLTQALSSSRSSSRSQGPASLSQLAGKAVQVGTI